MVYTNVRAGGSGSSGHGDSMVLFLSSANSEWPPGPRLLLCGSSHGEEQGLRVGSSLVAVTLASHLISGPQPWFWSGLGRQDPHLG